MNIYDILLAKKLGGGGGGSSVIVKPLNVNQNGTYTAPNGQAYSPVKVNVPPPKGTISINQNGSHDVTRYAYADVYVNPTLYDAYFISPWIKLESSYSGLVGVSYSYSEVTNETQAAYHQYEVILKSRGSAVYKYDNGTSSRELLTNLPKEAFMRLKINDQHIQQGYRLDVNFVDTEYETILPSGGGLIKYRSNDNEIYIRFQKAITPSFETGACTILMTYEPV